MRRFIPTAQVLAQPVRRFLPAQEGTTAIEYALIASGIAGAIIATVTTLGGTVTEMWTSVLNIFD
jgi:pilus assembly protein Flp/PilA